ncbi:MAG: phenol hydroxylase subunit P4 [Burkholderiaceae bacterium]|nr:phenol hydroxylase subunit P4 [Burkholderiaceae bacterium]
MAVIAIKPYIGEAKDGVDKFHGNQLLYIGWDDHLMFGAPFAFALPPSMRFGEIVAKLLPESFGAHPDFARIDWIGAQWFKSGQPCSLDFDLTLEQNGLKHKDALRFRTPGLTGIAGSRS